MKPIPVLFGLLLTLFGFASSQNLTCPDPKNKLYSRLCSHLQELNDTDYVTIQVDLPQKPDHDPMKTDTAYWDSLDAWSYRLFTTFDLRSYDNPDQRLSPPADSAVDWVYRLIKATKLTIVSMLDATYITTISESGPVTPVTLGTPLPQNSRKLRVNAHPTWYDLSGRMIQSRTSAYRALYPRIPSPRTSYFANRLFDSFSRGNHDQGMDGISIPFAALLGAPLPTYFIQTLKSAKIRHSGKVHAKWPKFLMDPRIFC